MAETPGERVFSTIALLLSVIAFILLLLAYVWK